MSTTLMPELALTAIIPHPKNPRHKAIADDDMVASVRENGLIQPVVVAPHPDKAGKFVPIAGHRRIDAAKKAKLTTVPAVLRTDLVTEGQQIEAMIIENGHRVDLTPIEEAEGYAQLELLGYKPAQIAAAVGRDIKTVRARLKLLKLAPSTRKKVHAGQLNLDDAAALTEFADDTEATKKLERALSGSAYDFKHTLQQLRRHRDARARIATEVAKLLERGATEVKLKAGELPYSMFDYDKGPCPVTRTFSDNWDQHNGCLGFVQYESEWHGPILEVLCTKPGSHRDQLDAKEREELEAREATDRERAARQEAEDVAASIRVETVLNLIGTNTTMPPNLRDVVRVLLPTLVTSLHDGDLRTYQQILNVPEADRWRWHGDLTSANNRPNITRLRSHLADIERWSDGILTKALVAVLIGKAEDNLTGGTWRRFDEIAADYYALLKEAGLELSPVDVELYAEVTGDDTAVAS